MYQYQGENMTDPKTPDVYSRIYLKTRPGDTRNMAIEYLDGGEDPFTGYPFDEWRLIDLNTGHVYSKDQIPHEALGEAAELLYSDEPKPEYVKEVKPKELRAFKDIPLKDQLRYIESEARDLEHDMKLESNDGLIQNPILEATKMLNDMYDYPCFYQEEREEAGKLEFFWDIDMDVVQGR